VIPDITREHWNVNIRKYICVQQPTMMRP